MRRILGAIACLAGLLWGGMIEWAVNRPETEPRTRVRTAAFIVMVGAGMIAAPSRCSHARDSQDEEETL
jgi:hypothetical protein